MPSPYHPFLTVVIPNYNETENLERGVLGEVRDYLASQDYAWEVVISDDGSTDQSLQIIKDFARNNPNFRVLDNPHEGKPHALRAGIAVAQGKYVLLTDMDQSTPIGELEKLLPFTKEGFSVVIGSRGVSRPNSSFFRKYIVSWGFLTVRRLILLPRIVDTQCGFKLLDTQVARDIFVKMRLFARSEQASGWKVTAYDVEMLFLARKMRIPIKEVRVSWRDEDTSTNKSRNFIKESLEMLTEIVRVRYNDLTGKYD